MEGYVTFIVRHRVAVVVAVLLVTCFFATQLKHLRLEINRRANLPQDHPYVQVQNRIGDIFGGEAIVIIGVVANQGDVFAPPILAKVSRITEGLRNTVGVVESSLFSLAAPSVKAITPGDDAGMEVRQLMEAPPTTAEGSLRVRRLVRDDPLFRGRLVSEDESATVIVAEFDDRVTDGAIAERVEALVAPERDSSVSIALAGAPILRAELAKCTALIAVLFPIAVLVIAIVHYEAFRTFQAMLLPLVTALLSVVWSLGVMGITGKPMDTWSAITPVVILAVAAGHAVQILKRYYEEYARVGDSRAAVIRSVTAVAPVMLTAGVIAATGFLSLITFGISSVRVFGLLMASGILSALIIEMTFTPACRALLPAPKNREVAREGQSYWLTRAIDHLADVVLAHPRVVVLGWAVLLLFAVRGAFWIDVDNSFRLWFASGTQVRKDDELMNRKLPGTASLRILVEGDRPGVLEEPDVLRAIDDLETFLEADPELGAITSVADHVKRMHQVLNGGDPAFYKIPDSKPLISQYLFLFGMGGGPDALSAFLDGEHQRALIRGLSKTDSAAFSRGLLERTQRFVDNRFKDLPITVGIAGGTIGVQTAMNDVVVHEKIVNIIQIATIIFVLSTLVLRSFLGGLVVLSPLVMAVIVNFGIMGWANVWLDMTTAAFTAMGVSIGADFAIYLIFRIREELQTLPYEAALRASLHTSGTAIFYVASAVALGYMVLPFAGFSVWTRLGVFTATIIGTSALATLTLVPAFALMARPKFLSHGSARETWPAERAVERAA